MNKIEIDLTSILSLMVSAIISLCTATYIAVILKNDKLLLWTDFYGKLLYGSIAMFFLLVLLYGRDSFIFDKPTRTMLSAILGTLFIYIATQITSAIFITKPLKFQMGYEITESLLYLGTVALQVVVAFSESMFFHIGIPYIFFRLGGKGGLFSGVVFSNFIFGVLHYYSWIAVLGKVPPLQIIGTVFTTWTVVCLVYAILKLKGVVNEAFILFGHLLYNLISISL